jgi:hypothetical protein
MSVKRAWMPVVTFVAVLVMAGPAGASEAKPLEVSRFTMHTTEKESIVEEPATGTKARDYRLESVPYTFTQAGGHPWALTTTVEFPNEPPTTGVLEGAVSPKRDAKDVIVDLPPGLLGNPNPVVFPRCPLALLLAQRERCPSDTQIGIDRLRWFGGAESVAPIVNVTPEKGQSAEFGLENNGGDPVVLTAHVVRDGSTYALTVVSNNIPNGIELVEVETTFWGVPSDPSHDPMRGLICSGGYKLDEGCGEADGQGRGGVGSGLPRVPFLTLPTDCGAGPERAVVRGDSWEQPGVFAQASAVLSGVTGCGLLQFGPELEVLPDKLGADEPVGLGVNLKVPQVESAEAPATPQLRDTVLTLPEGLSISPGIVDGIRACDESGPEGINFEGPESEEIGLSGESQLAAGHCPDASIVGTAKAFTPLLDEPVEGHVYLARPGCGGAGQEPCTEQDALDGNLYKLYLELGGHGALADTGVNLKVAFDAEANPATGQLTTMVSNTPPLPFSKLEVHLNGGPRAPLDNPAVCGPAVTSSELTPWSAPGTTPEGLLMAGTPDATPSSFYDVGGCASPVGLSPGFVAGTVTPLAGQYSAFTIDLSRQDREQYLKGIQIHTPPGLSGMLSSVPLCAVGEAEAGNCGEQSRIGSARVASGAGSHPFEIEGNVYLTGPYDGAPFGLSIVTHAVAGPFNLGVVVVRARIAVNREDATLTITTDETGPHAIPQIIDGVPLRLKRVTVNIDRPGFMFNPTNCGAPGQPSTQQVTGVISGSGEAKANVSSPLNVGACQSLAFKPSFTVATSGRTSKANGASLDARVSYPVGSFGTEANIASVKVALPKQLPSRLTTLQKACTAAQFEANPGGCPAASIVGIVKANTPLLPVELSGPVYFVSHGGEAFPSLIVVLQGDGVRVDLTGSTFISKAGITSSTFKTVPDVPVNTFELYLPEGPYSALSANSNLCDLTGSTLTKHKTITKAHGRTVRKTITTRSTKPASLLMPIEFIAQNGAVLKQNTKIEVTGCSTTKTKPKKKTKVKSTGKSNRRAKS